MKAVLLVLVSLATLSLAWSPVLEEEEALVEPEVEMVRGPSAYDTLMATPVPDSYSAVDLGLVTPAKNQGTCLTCVAFATAAALETCLMKAAGGSFGQSRSAAGAGTGTVSVPSVSPSAASTGQQFPDLSEQQLIDCRKENKTKSCWATAPTWAYIKYIVDNKLQVTDEASYPYLEAKRYDGYRHPTCPVTAPYSIGAKVTDWVSDGRSSVGWPRALEGSEEWLKKAVAQHGAVLSSIDSDGWWDAYKHGVSSDYIKADCKSSDNTHTITVVGYGTLNGKDYWLIKNSWFVIVYID